MPNLFFLKQPKNLIFFFILAIIVSLLIGIFLGKFFQAQNYETKILPQKIERAKIQEREKTKREIYQAMQRKYHLPQEPKIIQTIEGILQ